MSDSPVPKPVPKIDRARKFHFIHGDDERGLENFKHAVVEAHLTNEEREENYREIIPTGQPPSLKKVLGDVLSELSTVSFLPDVTRVVTLYTVNDFFEAKFGGGGRGKAGAKSKPAAADTAAKGTPSGHLAEFIETELPGLPAVLIVLVVEDHEKWKRVNVSNPLVALAANTGALRAFKEESPQFAFFDALFERRTGKALTLWRQWLERTGTANPKPYTALATQVRLLLQAKTAGSGQLAARGVNRARFASDFMPTEADRNVFALRPDWRLKKMEEAAANFQFSELLSAYAALEPLQKYAIPMNSDPWVPDRTVLAELWIARLTSRM